MGKINLIGADGADPEGMSMADFFCQARYHFKSNAGEMVIALGPQFSYMVLPDRYYIDADPNDPRSNKEKFLKRDIGLQPSVVIQKGKHFQCGIEASVGLRNMLRQYPEYNVRGKVFLHNLMFTFGWRF